MEKVRALQNMAYRLGVEEGTTMSPTIYYKIGKPQNKILRVQSFQVGLLTLTTMTFLFRSGIDPLQWA